MNLELKLLIGFGLLICVLVYGILRLWEKLEERNVALLVLNGHHQANVKELAETKDSLKTERDNIRQAQTKIESVKNKSISAEMRASWCDPRLLEMPPGVPEKLHKSTLVHARYALNEKLGSFYDLRDRSSFKAAGQWELYWCLAHATKAAVISSLAKMEDGITADFVRTLELEAKKLPSMIDEAAPALQLAYSNIFEQAKPALKEADVGADVLLVVAGDNLVPSGGARLFWIQAKKARSSTAPYVLDCSYKNTKDSQINALRKVNVPERGSFAVYCQYSNALPFIPSFTLAVHTPADDLKVDLAEHGVRISELISAYAGYRDKAVGVFADATAVTAFISSVAAGKPLYVVAATENNDRYLQRWNAHTLVKQIALHYQRELGRDRDLSFDQDRDDGPQLSR